MSRVLSATAILLGLFAAPGYGQLILAEPGQVVAGKTLLSASQPDLSFNELIFVGEFDEASEDDVVDVRKGVFTINLSTNSEKLLAWTGEAKLSGSPITEISSPKISGLGEIMFRVATPSLRACLQLVLSP